MSKKFLKIWNGEANFKAKEYFNSVHAASKMVVPSKAAVIEVDDTTVNFKFSTTKEVSDDNTLSTPGRANPGISKGEKKTANEDKQRVKK